MIAGNPAAGPFSSKVQGNNDRAAEIGRFVRRAGDLTGPFSNTFQAKGDSDWPANLDREVTAGANEARM